MRKCLYFVLFRLIFSFSLIEINHSKQLPQEFCWTVTSVLGSWCQGMYIYIYIFVVVLKSHLIIWLWVFKMWVNQIHYRAKQGCCSFEPQIDCEGFLLTFAWHETYTLITDSFLQHFGILESVKKNFFPCF